ncbi:suppression of tumorigenicity 5 protein isoform x4 [Limosa lapponica baueri]|uniref:Suppression of tumorigenicity 5 protein isoform x4 n=1 Tax=Limosa lapponica baueri TaxID=1758121 RepID=A0A2I0UHK8_LIMLA|nr:suppression of tumorigenicity 5 protein isoform x4 [Limosa lapponica baueri]
MVLIEYKCKAEDLNQESLEKYKPVEVHSGADIHPPADLGGAHARASGYLKEALIQWEACAGAGSWKVPHDPVGDPHWTSLFLKDCTLWKGPMLEQFIKNCTPWEGVMLEKFMKDCLLWDGPHPGAGEECEESFL